MNVRDWPEIGEFVVCTVKKVMDFGVFVELDEYGKKEKIWQKSSTMLLAHSTLPLKKHGSMVSMQYDSKVSTK